MNRFKNIVYFADGTTEPDHALERAFLLAENNQARLTLLDVIEPVDIPQDLTMRFGFDLQDMLIQKRLEELEGIATSYDGVNQAYAVEAGREVRVIVDAEHVEDRSALKLARDIAKQIEETVTYPGEIKVTVLRELRAVEYAR